MKKMLFAAALLAISAMVLLSGCSTAKFIRTGATVAAKPDNCEIEVFSSKLPDRKYEELGIIEGEGFLDHDTLEKVLPKMKIEACRAGGDAIIIKSSQKYNNDEDEKIFITATVIRWVN